MQQCLPTLLYVTHEFNIDYRKFGAVQSLTHFKTHCQQGFTAWSSTREPAQVFVLLQTVYQSFDILANKHKVFKVETIGDSYVAATGLPHEQPLVCFEKSLV